MNDKTFEIYFKKHFLFPELSKKEEMKCIITIQYLPENISVGRCIKKLVKVTLRTVLSVAKKYKGMGLPLEDLVQEGCFGINDAIKTFDPFYNPQTRFATHAYYHIKNRILEALNTDRKLIQNEVVSLDALSKVPAFEQQLDVEGPKTPEDELVEKSNEEYLVSCLEKLLTPTEFRIALYLIGFKYIDYEQLTPKELAEKIGVNPGYIRRIKRKIRKTLITGGLLIKCGKNLKKHRVNFSSKVN